MITRENDKDSFPRRAKGQLSSTGKKTPGESPGNTRDTHGTHGRTRAHGSHRQTSQPSKPNDTSSTGIERAFNHHAWLRTSHVPIELQHATRAEVVECRYGVHHFFTPNARPNAFLGVPRRSSDLSVLAALPIDASTWRSQPMRTEQGHPTNSTTDHA